MAFATEVRTLLYPRFSTRGFRLSVMDCVVFGFMMSIRVAILEDLVDCQGGSVVSLGQI